jgi:hypothetical protein
VRKATAAALRHATDLQAGSEASIARSQQIVREAQETGTDTAILLKSQTEQLKSIYAEVSEMDDNIKRAKKSDAVHAAIAASIHSCPLFVCFVRDVAKRDCLSWHFSVCLAAMIVFAWL